MAGDVCGHVVWTAELPVGRGGWCCWRPVAAGRERCRWHATGALDDYASALDQSDDRLDDAVLRGEDLDSLPIDGCSLARADLAGATLSTTVESGCLRGADLSDATLDHADLSGADLRDATLAGATLLHADLSAARLRHADLSGADLRFAAASAPSLVRADLTDANASGADLSDATLLSARLEAATFRRTDLSGGNLRRADAVAADLGSADVRGADLYEADLRDADLRGADLSGANLRHAHLSGADLSDADLTDATLEGADLRGATLERAEFVRTNLFDADLSRAVLYGGVFADVKVNRGTVLDAPRPTGADDDPLDELVWTNRTIERLSRENALVEQARTAYVRRKDLRRRQHRRQGNYARWAGSAVAGAVMGYGERPLRVVAVSAAVVFAAALLYPGPLSEAAYASLASFVTPLPDPSLGTTGRWLSAMEALTGALLTAVLVFVFGRRSTG
ncbi:pentapeptide repeat-containing protein [Halomarina litorea]|uniref:pentapeptide repeat-containing protein n=1 Tax=Halomarina litorea TaxID=2961595 RepID=UPI0020C383CE|nr:pentapeptide repeat-containing protein [Halomarina sp. BCD28]